MKIADLETPALLIDLDARSLLNVTKEMEYRIVATGRKYSARMIRNTGAAVC